MVDISLYNGNLHRVPDVPCQWKPPAPKMSHEDFVILIGLRARAESRLQSDDDDDDVTSTSSASPSPASSPDRSSDSDRDIHVDHRTELSPKGGLMENGREYFLGKSMEKTDDLMEVEGDDKPEVLVNSVVEKSNTENGSSDVEKRKKEVEEKLEILNEKKHSLVQVLKQILNAEEHLKRQNNAQGTPSRRPLVVDTITDTGLMTKVKTPRVGLNGNPCGDVEGGESGDASNHNVPSLNLPCMSSISPSSHSQQRKPASGMVPHSYRTPLTAAAGSPSRLAPGGPGQHSSVTVTASGTSYIASSPSPAASVGTSVFRDGKLPSPWN